MLDRARLVLIQRGKSKSSLQDLGSIIDAAEHGLSLEHGERECSKHMLCPISGQIMRDPVIASDGNTYERSAIKLWVDQGNLGSPLNPDTLLSSSSLYPNHQLRLEISSWKSSDSDQHPQKAALTVSRAEDAMRSVVKDRRLG